jgi:hypothetical protein
MIPVWFNTRKRKRGRGPGGVMTIEAPDVIPAMCTECQMIMVAVVQGSEYTPPAGVGNDRAQHAGRVLNAAYSVRWYPATADEFEFPHVPDAIARAAEEAHQAGEIGARMAAILMARTAVEATAKDKGITSGRLVQKIDELRDKGFIRKPIADAAHEIRHLGNDMAHGDITDPPDEHDTTDVLALMDAVLRDVYETTAITTGIINRRQG